MPNAKKITLDWSETGKTVYAIVRREADNYRLDDADGTFASNPADPYLSLSEDSVIKGRYEVSESRQSWNDGKYTVAIYSQSGGSPSPVSDVIAGTGEIVISGDLEVTIHDLSRALGLTLENFVEDDIVRDGNDNKTSSVLYCYNSAANATTHDKATGLIVKYNVTVTYTSNKMSLFKSIKQ